MHRPVLLKVAIDSGVLPNLCIFCCKTQLVNVTVWGRGGSIRQKN